MGYLSPSHVEIIILISKLQWQIFQIQQLCMHTLYSVILACHWRYRLFVHWWMKGIYFASFYFRVCDLTCKIHANKNLAKISTYTVLCKPICCNVGELFPKVIDNIFICDACSQAKWVWSHTCYISSFLLGCLNHWQKTPMKNGSLVAEIQAVEDFAKQ